MSRILPKTQKDRSWVSGVRVKTQEVVQSTAFASLGDLGIRGECATDMRGSVVLCIRQGLDPSGKALSFGLTDTLYRLFPTLGLVRRIPSAIRGPDCSHGGLIRRG